MKVRTVNLADIETVDNKGKKEIRKINEREVGLVLNNRALKYGLDKGYIETSNIGKLLTDLEADIDLAWSLIYLGAVGGNKDFEDDMTRDEFIDKLDLDLASVNYKAQSLIMADLPDTYDEFVEKLKAKTGGESGKK